MTIETLDQLHKAARREYTHVLINKSSINNTTYTSLWAVSSLPASGAIPTTAAVCTKALTGAMPFADKESPKKTYMYEAWFAHDHASQFPVVEIHDRIAHMGGLSMTSTSLQTVGVNLGASGLNPAANRIGDSNFSDIMWWFECYVQGGGTGVNATVNVTYDDDSTGALTLVPIPALMRATSVIPLNGYIPAAASGKYIKSVDSIQLSASTTVVGNLGVTATRCRSHLPLDERYETKGFDYSAMGSNEVINEACLFIIYRTPATTTGVLNGILTLVHG